MALIENQALIARQDTHSGDVAQHQVTQQQGVVDDDQMSAGGGPAGLVVMALPVVGTAHLEG